MYPLTFRYPGLLVSSSFLWLVLADDGPDVWPVLNVPLSFDSAGRYVMKVSMSEGATRQNFTFTFTTGSGLVYVGGVGGGLSTASEVPLYDQISSSTAQHVSNDTQASLLGAPADAAIVKESCGIGGDHDSLWTYTNQTIVVIKNATANNTLENSLSTVVGTEISGILGLGLNRGSSMASDSAGFTPTHEDSIAGGWLYAVPVEKATKFTWAMALEPPVIVPQVNLSASSRQSAYASSAGMNAGLLHLLQPDPSFYDPDQVQWTDANSGMERDSSSLPQSDWTVILDRWVASGGGPQLSSSGQIVAKVDPLYPGVYVPRSLADLIHALIPGASLQPGLSTLGDISNAYTIPCDTQMSFSVIVGSHTFVMDRANLVLDISNSQCASSIEAWSDPNETQYLFGSRFLSEAYLIFLVPRNGTQRIGFTHRLSGHSGSPSETSSGGSSNTKAIVGGSVGGGILLILIVLGAFFFWRHWKKSAKPTPSPAAKPTLDAEFDPLKAATDPRWNSDHFSAFSPTSLTYQTPPDSPTTHTSPISPLRSPNRRNAVDGSALSLYHHTQAFQRAPSPSAVTRAIRNME